MSIKAMPYTTVEQVLRLREAAIQVEENRDALAAHVEAGKAILIERHPSYALRKWVEASPETSLARRDVHPDDAAVGRFAECMKAKLAKARENGRDGWDDPDRCSVEMLCDLLLEHLEKGNDGNYVDIANLAMMLHLRCASSELLRREVLRRDARMKAEVLEKAMYKALSGDQPLTAHWLHEMAEAYRRQAEEEE